MFKNISNYRAGNHIKLRDRDDLFICIDSIEAEGGIVGRITGYQNLNKSFSSKASIYTSSKWIGLEIEPIPFSFDLIKWFPEITAGDQVGPGNTGFALLNFSDRLFRLYYDGNAWTSSDFYHMSAKYVHEFQNILEDITGQKISFKNS